MIVKRGVTPLILLFKDCPVGTTEYTPTHARAHRFVIISSVHKAGERLNNNPGQKADSRLFHTATHNAYEKRKEI